MTPASIDDGRLAPGERHHVHAELAEPAKRNDFEQREYVTRHTDTTAVPGRTITVDGSHRPGGSVRRWARLKLGGGS